MAKRRLEEFVTLTMQRTGPQTVGVIEGKAMLDLDLIQALAPATVPSELKGPDDMPIATQACTVFLSGGQFTVKEIYQTMVEKWIGTRKPSKKDD